MSDSGHFDLEDGPLQKIVATNPQHTGRGIWWYSLFLLALVGLADSIYLTYVKLVAGGVCIAGNGCETVNLSPYSQIGVVPVALLGALSYIIMLAILLMENSSEFFEFNGPLMLFGLSFFGVLYSAYLTYLEIYVIKAICPFCVVSAVVLVLMLIISSLRLRATFKAA